MSKVKTPLEVLREIKEKVQDNTLPYPKHGICYNFKVLSDYENSLNTVMRNNRIHFDQWELFSGNTTFPVPGRKGSNPGVVFNSTGDMWDTDKLYNRRRHKLLDWLIQRFEQVEQKNEQNNL